ncbi:hypothetical protein ACFV4G_09675 [Kitasatospora sp. NPDC059747]|uniref:hypothetical protein n=1 Tax=Kitasatospora sp. NPDC059747 TaxID=3346930 RepID=UPI003667D305
MRQLDERAVHVLAAALKEIPLLENGDRRADLVHSIREAPGVVEFEVTFDNATHTHLTRITRSCIRHSNAPAARQALYEEARRLAGGQRAVSWLRFFNAVLDSRHPDGFKEWLLDNGGLLLAQGWGSSTAPGVPDPLSEFTWLVVGGSEAQVREFCSSIPGLPSSVTIAIPTPHGDEPEPREPKARSRRTWWLAGGVGAVVLAMVVWAIVSAGGDRPAVPVSVRWNGEELSRSVDGTSTLSTKVNVPAGRTRVEIPLNLSDKNPDSGECHETTVEMTIGGWKSGDRKPGEVVRAKVPANQPTLDLELTLSPKGCTLLVNIHTVDFKD